MNKQELIEQIKCLKNIFGNKTKYIEKDTVIKLISELDEPQKVVVPKFVADWYENHKDDLEYDIWEYILRWGEQQKSEFYEWMNHANNKPLQTLANMHQFGYEVEKEKRYIIKLKGVPNGAKFLKYAKVTQEWYFGMKGHYSDKEIRHTRKELEEAGFGWVFDCEGIEVEEVEE